MAEKKMFATRIDNDLLKELKHLGVDTEAPMYQLLEEAIRDLLKKYQRAKYKG
jgi:predicted transcriptional regulator